MTMATFLDLLADGAPRAEFDRLLAGSELAAQLDRWEENGVLEPSAAAAVRDVAANPDWLSLRGRTVVALGAGSEIGPTPVLLDWGATVAGIDLPREQLWSRVVAQAAASAGTLLVPLHTPGGAPDTGRAGPPSSVVDWRG